MDLTPNGSVDWEKRCYQLEAQILRFKEQVVRIRENLGEKMKELESQADEAATRADKAESRARDLERQLAALQRNTQAIVSSSQAETLRQKDNFIEQLKNELIEVRRLRGEELHVVEQRAKQLQQVYSLRLQEAEKHSSKPITCEACCQTSLVSMTHSSSSQEPADLAPEIPIRPISTVLKAADSTLRNMDQANIFSLSQEDYVKSLPHPGSKKLKCLEESAAGASAKSLDAAKSLPLLNDAPAPPLHRYPSWEKRIYAVASSGTGLQMSSGDASINAASIPPHPGCLTYSSSSSLFEPPGTSSTIPRGAVAPCGEGSNMTREGGKHGSIPVFTQIGGKAHRISDSSYETADWASLLAASHHHTFSHSLSRAGAGEARPAASALNGDDFSDYSLPPDAAGDNLTDAMKLTHQLNLQCRASLAKQDFLDDADEHADYCVPPDAVPKDLDHSDYIKESDIRAIISKSSTLNSMDQHPHSTAHPSSTASGSILHSGYLSRLGDGIKTWQRWRATLQSQSLNLTMDGSLCQIKLNLVSAVCRTKDNPLLFNLTINNKKMVLSADSGPERDGWVKAIAAALYQLPLAHPQLMPWETGVLLSSWLTVICSGLRRRSYAVLCPTGLYLLRRSTDRRPYYSVRLRNATISHNPNPLEDSACFPLDEEAPELASNKAYYLLLLTPVDTPPVFLCVDSPDEMEEWKYQLTVVSGCGFSVQQGTEFERLIAQLMAAPTLAHEEELWADPLLLHAKECLIEPLTSNRGEGLKIEAVKLFKTIQLFIKAPLDPNAIDYHISLAQNAFSKCLQHKELQNEAYCQIIRQSRLHKQDSMVQLSLQCWQLLAMAVSLFLPRHAFLWLFRSHLARTASRKHEIGKYAIYCQRMMERIRACGGRQYRTSKLEMLSLLTRNPFALSHPMSVPVHFLNGSAICIGFLIVTIVGILLIYAFNYFQLGNKNPRTELRNKSPAGDIKKKTHLFNSIIKI